jgi:hypothetical protein
MSSDTTEHEVRDGAPPNDGPVGGPPGPSAETDRSAENDAPTGLPTQSYEAVPLGTTEEDPDGTPHGEEQMPGIPTGGEPPTSG